MSKALIVILTATAALVAAGFGSSGAIGRRGLVVPVQDAPAVTCRADAGMDARAALPRLPVGQGASRMAAVEPTFVGAFDDLQRTHEVRESVRLVRDGAAVEDEGTAIAGIRKHLDDNGIDPTRLAAALDVRPNVVRTLFESPATIPAGPRFALIRDAQRWCKADAEQREARKSRFVQTAATRIVCNMARLVRDVRVIGLVTGGPGFGKSHAAQVAAAELPGETIVVRCDTDSRSAKGILRAVGFAGAAGFDGASVPSVKHGIEAAKRGNGLLIVDEAQMLGVNALEALRAVFDQAGVGVLLLGTTQLGRTLHTDGDALSGPLVSRIALRVDLDDELAGDWIDAPTLREILRRAGVDDLEPAAAAALLKIANEHGSRLRAAIDAARVAHALARARDRWQESVRVRADDIVAARRMRGER